MGRDTCTCSDGVRPTKEGESVDAITLRPREPNDLYSDLTKEQLDNMRKSSSPFFSYQQQPRLPSGRFYVDRYSHCVDAKTLRAANSNGYYCFVGERVQPLVVPEHYDSSMVGASVKWGPPKAGISTVSHNAGETRDRYTNIDMYRRNPTNCPSDVTMKYGRPHTGYYLQKYPVDHTWFNSGHQLNQTKVLAGIRPKTLTEYKLLGTQRRERINEEDACWPHVSEQTAKLGGKQRTFPNIYDSAHGRSFFEATERNRLEKLNEM